MKKWLVLIIVFGLIPHVWAVPEDPNTPTTVNHDINGLLDRVEKRGTELSSFQAGMTVRESQPLVDALTIRQGALYYQVKDQEVRFQLHFDTWQQIDLEEDSPSAPVKQDLDWFFDGRWLHKRDARTKTLQSWEVSKEPARRTDFSLGKGPFPLPFAIKKDDVLRQFEVKLIPADPNDPAHTDHVYLTPKKDSKFADDYVSLELWVLQEQAMPVQLRFEKNDSEITTVTWSDGKIDTEINGDKLTLLPVDKGWTIEETPLSSEGK